MGRGGWGRGTMYTHVSKQHKKKGERKKKVESQDLQKNL
jgi:hypothetical protein